jgi:hypothetical protein
VEGLSLSPQHKKWISSASLVRSQDAGRSNSMPKHPSLRHLEKI